MSDWGILAGAQPDAESKGEPRTSAIFKLFYGCVGRLTSLFMGIMRDLNAAVTECRSESKSPET